MGLVGTFGTHLHCTLWEIFCNALGFQTYPTRIQVEYYLELLGVGLALGFIAWAEVVLEDVASKVGIVPSSSNSSLCT